MVLNREVGGWGVGWGGGEWGSWGEFIPSVCLSFGFRSRALKSRSKLRASFGLGLIWSADFGYEPQFLSARLRYVEYYRVHYRIWVVTKK